MNFHKHLNEMVPAVQEAALEFESGTQALVYAIPTDMPRQIVLVNSPAELLALYASTLS
jgi:hypothetical protein